MVALLTNTGNAVSTVASRLNPLRLPTSKEAPQVEDVASDESFQKFKEFNTDAGQEINFWREMAGYLRWGALGLMAGTLTAVGAAFGIADWFSTQPITPEIAEAAKEAAKAAKDALWALAPATTAVGAAAIASSQYAMKVGSERYIDVENYKVMRQASLTGKSVVAEIKSEMHNARKASIPDIQATHSVAHNDQGSWRERIETTRIEANAQAPVRG